MAILINGNLATRAALTLAFSLAAWTPGVSQAAEPAKAKKMAMDSKTMEHSKMDHSKVMMERCQSMMAEMKTQDAELATQVALMNNAAKDSKVDLIAAIVTKMAEQRAAMNVRMGQMHMEMMKHMEMSMATMSHHSKMKGMDHKSGDVQKITK